MKKIFLFLAAIIATFVASHLFTRCAMERKDSTQAYGTVYDTIRVIDTIAYYQPQAKSVKPTGLNTSVKVNRNYLRLTLDSLPRIRADTATTALIDSNEPDSVELQLPITQSIYEGKDYKAYVSGVNTSLDSMFVFPTHEVVTITVKKPPKRWHIGLQGGYGFTQNGPSTYIGVGVTYSLISF